MPPNVEFSLLGPLAVYCGGAPVAHFTGRGDELAVLTGLLERSRRKPGTLVISAIGGTAGVGKTIPGAGHTSGEVTVPLPRPAQVRNVPQRGTMRTSPSSASARNARATVPRATP
jgi:hypothetical protein